LQAARITKAGKSLLACAPAIRGRGDLYHMDTTQNDLATYTLSVKLRPGLTDCGALGKIILGGPQNKAKTKKKKKKKVTATCYSHSTPITMSSTIFLS